MGQTRNKIILIAFKWRFARKKSSFSTFCEGRYQTVLSKAKVAINAVPKFVGISRIHNNYRPEPVRVMDHLSEDRESKTPKTNQTTLTLQRRGAQRNTTAKKNYAGEYIILKLFYVVYFYGFVWVK